MVDQPANNEDPQDTQDDIHLNALPPSTQDPDPDTAEQQNIPELSELAVELHHHLEEAEKAAAKAHHVHDADDEPLPEVEPDAAPVAATELQKLVDTAQAEVDSLSVRAPRDVAEPQVETQEIEPQRVGGIEILVQMAAKGEIDPKNIDIIDVCDRFLQAIASVPKENLRQSGKILFHASVLLRLKAESLLVDNIQDLDGGDDFLDFDADGSPIFYDANNEPIARQITLRDLERALVRRSHNKQFRQRRVTLEQLIDALKEAEHLERERVTKKPKARIDLEGQAQVQDFGDILDLAHDEDIDAIITRAEGILAECFAKEDRMSMIDFLRHLGSRNDWVDAFLAVLFLSNAGKIVLEQERFYGPLFLMRPSDADSEAANGTVAAPNHE